MGRDYTKIKAWQLADELAFLIYEATKKFPKSEIMKNYGRRARKV